MRRLAGRFVASVVPPVLYGPLRRAAFGLGLAKPLRIWSGTYATFAEVPVRGPGYAGDRYRAGVVDTVRGLMATRCGAGSDAGDESRTLLAQLTAVLHAETARPVRIVDFGGGPGIAYAHILCGLGGQPQLEFHVVELESVCEDGRRLFGGDPRIQFHAVLAASLQEVDIVHAGGVIEFMEDWAGTLRGFCRLAPRYVLLTNVCCGDFATYATGFNLIRGSVIANWQLNTDSVVDVMAASGYRLALRSLHERVHAQDNFPKALRLPDGHPSALLFTATQSRSAG